MSDDSGISYSYSTSYSTTPGMPSSTGAPALYAFANCELIPVDHALTLVINRDNGKQQLISPQVVDALKTCTTFRSLAEHADQLARTRPELKGNRTLALQALEQVRDAGLLLAADTIRARLGTAAERSPGANPGLHHHLRPAGGGRAAARIGPAHRLAGPPRPADPGRRLPGPGQPGGEPGRGGAFQPA